MKIICIPKTYNLCFTLDSCIQYEQIGNTFVLQHVASHVHRQTKLTLKAVQLKAAFSTRIPRADSVQ